MSNKTSHLILGAILAGIVSFGHSLEAIAQQNTTTNSDDISIQEMLKKKNKPNKDNHNNRNRNDDNDNYDDDDDNYDDNYGNNQLPGKVKNAIRQDLARILGIPPGKIKIKNVRQQNWPNSCLGLAQRGEFCAQVIVTGWRVEAFYNRQQYIYRTNNNGRIVRLENSNNTTNTGGGIQTTNINVTRISSNELPQPLRQNAIFRTISTGGIAGQMYETTLMNDGRMIRVLIDRNGNRNRSQREVWQISARQLQQFQTLLQQRQLRSLNMNSYDPSRNAADYITMTMTSENWTIRYADIVQNDLPNSLREVAVFWQQISRR